MHSARFNGESYAEKFATIQRMLAECGTDSSPARFVCALALTRTDGAIWETTGVVEGRLRLPSRGDAGFGYDPIFVPAEFRADPERTFARLSAAGKDRLSHGGKALRRLAEVLPKLLATA